MAYSLDERRRVPRSARAFLNDPKLRGAAAQILLVGFVGSLVFEAVSNALDNLHRAKIASGFGFLGTTSGFDINQSLIPYSSSGSTYGDALLVGLINTLIVAAIGIVVATVLGFLVGVARLSGNWIVATLATFYVETLRNVPLLVQLLFWYFGVLAGLPAPRDSIDFGAGVFLNVRGLYVPKPVFSEGAGLILAALVIGILASVGFRIWTRRRQMRTGRRMPFALPGVALVLGPPALVWLALVLGGSPAVSFEVPQRGPFNLRGGLHLLPEFVALVVGLTTYTAAFIAEIVRAGILAVPRSQTEAARALGLRPSLILRLVVLPQAMRVIVPPLTSQYLNLTKNSSLAVAIGYPDLVQVFMGTVLNQTGQALEVVAITMAVYLALSLCTSAAMNAYNRRVAVVER